MSFIYRKFYSEREDQKARRKEREIGTNKEEPKPIKKKGVSTNDGN